MNSVMHIWNIVQPILLQLLQEKSDILFQHDNIRLIQKTLQGPSYFRDWKRLLDLSYIDLYGRLQKDN